MTEKWLITGGCGFVGTNLAAALLEAGHEVVALDNLSRLGSAENLAWLRQQAARPGAGRFTFLPGDTRSRTDVDAAFDRHGPGATAVAHVAGQVAMTTSIERPRHDFEVNALGALNVLEAIRRACPGAAALFSSTNKVYGDLAHLRTEEAATRWTLPDRPDGLDEREPLEFHSPYGCSKGAADQYFLDYHRIYGLRTVVFRHSSMYGGRQFATWDQGWVGWFVGEVLRQQAEAAAGAEPAPFTISGDGKQVRDLLHADDLVACYRQAAARVDGCAGRAFNVGGGMASSLSLLELFEELRRLTGQAARFTRLPWRASDQKVFVADTRAAREAFGWAPRVGREDGLGRMIAWVARRA
jgi:CDP-paratose 2-epimerase